MSVRHVLKCWPEPFAALRAGEKLHEVRHDDRGFQVGDFIELREWDPRATYTGRALTFRIGYLSRGPEWGIPVGLVVFTLLSPEDGA